MNSHDVLIDLIILDAIWALGSTQPLIEMSTMNVPGSKERPARKAYNLAVTREPTV
jgi:hypothetical protein